MISKHIKTSIFVSYSFIVGLKVIGLMPASAKECSPQPPDVHHSQVTAKENPEGEAIDKQLSNCLDKSNSTADQMNCCETAYKAWDKKLNTTYHELMKELPAGDKFVLKQSELAWIKYRDKEFQLNDDIYARASGSMYRPLRINHRIEMVKARVHLLEDWLAVPNDESL